MAIVRHSFVIRQAVGTMAENEHIVVTFQLIEMAHRRLGKYMKNRYHKQKKQVVHVRAGTDKIIGRQIYWRTTLSTSSTLHEILPLVGNIEMISQDINSCKVTQMEHVVLE